MTRPAAAQWRWAAGFVRPGASTLTAQMISIYGSHLILALCADESASASAWNDQSGNSNNFTQGTGANQPVLHTGGTNGKSYLTFDGSNDQMNCASFTNLSAGEGVTVFIVKSRGGSSASKTCFEMSKSSSGGDTDSVVAVGQRFNGVDQYRTTFNSTQVTLNDGTTNNSGTTYLSTMWVNTGSSLLSSALNAGSATTTSIGANTLTNSATVAAIGSTAPGAAFWDGDFYAIFVADQNDDTNRASGNTTIKTYYGL